MGLYVEGKKIVLPRKSEYIRGIRKSKNLLDELRRIDESDIINNQELLDELFDLFVILNDFDSCSINLNNNSVEALSLSGYSYDFDNGIVSEDDVEKVKKCLFSALGRYPGSVVTYNECIYINYEGVLLYSYIASVLAMKQILKINPKYFKEFKECIILSLAFSLNYYVGGTEKLNELIGVFAERFY